MSTSIARLALGLLALSAPLLAAPSQAGARSLASASGSGILTSTPGCTPEWLGTFGGEPGLNGRVLASAVFDDGMGAALYVGGDFTGAGGQTASHIARWDGSAWSPLGSGLDGRVLSLAVHDDGSGPALYAGGWFTSAGGQAASRIARWDGSAWSALGSGLDLPVQDLAVFDDGSGPALYAGGWFTSAGGQAASRIAKWNGSAWSALGTGVEEGVEALAVYDAGSGPALYAGGAFTSAGGQAASGIARWDGSAWSPLGSGISGPERVVRTLEVYDDGSGAALHVGGKFEEAGGYVASNIARWDGAGWSALGSGVWDGEVLALTVFDDGSGAALGVGGTFTVVGGQAANLVARWKAGAWSPLGNGVEQEIGVYPSVSTLASFDGGSGPALYAGGHFLHVEGLPASRIAKWESGAWSALGRGLNKDVWTLATLDLGSGAALYAGGDFTAAGGRRANRIARWDGSTWSALGSGIGWGGVGALALFDDGTGPALFAGGWFLTAGDQWASGIAKWDGSAWSPLGTGVAGGAPALAVFDDGSGPALFAAGSFDYAGGLPVKHIAKWDGNAWSPLSSEVNLPVRALVVFDDGGGDALYAGGDFSGAGGQPASRIARWDGTFWAPLGSGMDHNVNVLAVFDDGGGPALYAGGEFSTAGGLPAARVAKWDGNAWSPLGSGLSSGVHSLAVFDDGSGPALYAGGTFSLAGGLSADRIARWDGSAWTQVGSGMGGGVFTLAVFDDGSGDGLYAGGSFTTSHAGDSYLAKLGCESTHGLPYCFGDGSGTPCPCGNAGAAGEGCANSTARGAILLATGSTSVGAADLVLRAAHLPPSQPGLYFQGTTQVNGGAGAVFGDGLRCAGGASKRLEVAAADAAGHSRTTLDIAAQGSVSAGDTRTYQLWYRDSSGGSCGSSFNLTNGLQIAWQP